MKRVLFFLCCLTATLSCTQEQDLPFVKMLDADGSESVIASANDFLNGNELPKTVISQEGTSAPTFAWKEGDVIGVIPMDNKTIQSNYEIASISTDPKQAVFDGGVWALKEGKEYAAYYPFNEKIARSGDNLTFSFLGQKQSDNNSLEHLGAYDYMYASPVVCANNAANFHFEHLISLVRLQLTVPSTGTFNAVSLESTEPWFASSANLQLADGTITAVTNQNSFRMELNDIQITAGNILTLWFSVLPTTSLKNKTLNVKLFRGDSSLDGKITIPDEWNAGKAYSYATTLSSTVAEIEYVDLGLPSGLKWATCNLGASSPEEYGDYYAWGEVETKDYFSLDNYKFYRIDVIGEYVDDDGFFHERSEIQGYTKYVTSRYSSKYGYCGFYDDKTILDPEDDVAHVKLGGKWRMPTHEECEELVDNCQSAWGQYKGVTGIKFTGTKSGYTDKWIFIPEAGVRMYDRLEFTVTDKEGDIWSSSLHVSLPPVEDAYVILFRTQSLYLVVSGRHRFLGQSVRPVSE